MAEPFELYPAIDVAGGRPARLVGGRPSSLVARAGDPVDEARALVSAGARWLHVVDLDAAISGEPRNGDVLSAIAALGVPVQAGGGLSPDGVDSALAAGAARAILGARWLGDPSSVAATVRRLGYRVGVGLDVAGGRVAPRGSDEEGPELEIALATIARARPAFVVHTSVDRDGALAGPDLDGLRAVGDVLRIPVIASGGVRSLRDLLALRSLAPAVGGAVVGRALQEGRFGLREALDAMRA